MSRRDRVGVRPRPRAGDDTGSTPVEFVLVGMLLTVLTLGVLQLGLLTYVRNVVHDAAVEGAYHAALADTTLVDGADRTRQIITRTVGARFADDVTARVVAGSAETGTGAEHSVVAVTVRGTLPLVGLLGAPRSLEVTGSAPLESFD